MLDSEQIVYIRKQMRKEKININTIDFFLNLVDKFEVTDEISSTSDKLARNFGRSDRSIQRYVKSLKEKDYLFVKPIWNNNDPDRPYITRNIYRLTPRAKKLIDQSVHRLDFEKDILGVNY